MPRPQLKDVTLFCVHGDDNCELTLTAGSKCTEQCDFGDVIIQHRGNLKSKRDYDIALTRDFPASIFKTSHILVFQYDGYITNGQRWRPEWLAYDYIGAAWPWHPKGLQVGNGGFSLRSLALMKAVRYYTRLWNVKYWDAPDPDDVIICNCLRDFLSRQRYKFATTEVAEEFAFERGRPQPKAAFGFHGLYNFPYFMAVDDFYANVDPKLAPYVKRSMEYKEVLQNFAKAGVSVA